MVGALRQGKVRKSPGTGSQGAAPKASVPPKTSTKRRPKKHQESPKRSEAAAEETSNSVEPEGGGAVENKSAPMDTIIEKKAKKKSAKKKIVSSIPLKGNPSRDGLPAKTTVEVGVAKTKKIERKRKMLASSAEESAVKAQKPRTEESETSSSAKDAVSSAKKQSNPLENIDESVLKSAVQALLENFKRTHSDANSTETGTKSVRLIAEDARISLVFNLNVPPANSRFKPKRIQLKHSMYTKGESDICMFVKDPVDIVKGVLDTAGYGGVTRVIGLSELKTDFNTHERKRTLASTYDLFLCDSRVIPSMPKLLGNFFSKTKKMPMEVDLNRKLPDVIERAVSSTSLHLPKGTCMTVHIGTTNLSVDKLVENVSEAIPRIARYVQNETDSVQSIHIKTTRSTALPIYTSLPTLVKIVPVEEDEEDVFSKNDLYLDDVQKQAKVFAFDFT